MNLMWDSSVGKRMNILRYAHSMNFIMRLITIHGQCKKIYTVDSSSLSVCIIL